MDDLFDVALAVALIAFGLAWIQQLHKQEQQENQEDETMRFREEDDTPEQDELWRLAEEELRREWRDLQSRVGEMPREYAIWLLRIEQMQGCKFYTHPDHVSKTQQHYTCHRPPTSQPYGYWERGGIMDIKYTVTPNEALVKLKEQVEQGKISDWYDQGETQ